MDPHKQFKVHGSRDINSIIFYFNMILLILDLSLRTCVVDVKCIFMIV